MSSARRASEDARFRAFLSSHFDAQTYVTNVIREGRSEECFAEMTSNIVEVDEEIKSYISLHKHDLMNGMHDVADLAKRYDGLASASKKLRGAVDKMQKETASSYDLVKNRTLELERIHDTSVILRQLRQFVHAKAQLDHYVSADQADASEHDLRQFAAMAKTVHEMESLVRMPQLAAIALVAAEVDGLRRLGSQLRTTARQRLLTALNEQNQTTVGDCLQVFYNVHSLSEVVLLAVDETVKTTADISAASLDVHVLMEGSTTAPAGKTSREKKGQLAGAPSQHHHHQLISNPMQLRMAMREMCHQWAAAVQEQAVKIHVLQRVIAKKEDPTTHERFIDVLQQSSASGSTVAPLLAAGRLVDVFWHRLSTSLQEVISAKVRALPSIAPRVYPSLRRAALEAFAALKGLAARSSVAAAGPVQWADVLYSSSSDEDEEGAEGGRKHRGGHWHREGTGGEGRVQLHGKRRQRAVGLFGSMLTTSAPYCISSLPSEKRLALHRRQGGCGAEGQQRDGPGEEGGRGSGGKDFSHQKESGLLSALGPMRDRYLAAALSRMNAPVLQMFPEVEGYTAAVPSKRDLLTLVKAIQDEVTTVVLEGDLSLVKLLSKEALKSVQLLLTKVENMASVGPESIRVVFHNGQYSRTGPQEHNGHLVVLVAQLQEAIQNITGQVVKATRDSPGSALSAAASASSSLFGSGGTMDRAGRADTEEEVLSSELHVLISSVAKLSTDLAQQLLSPLVSALTDHFREILLEMLREGQCGGPSTSSDSSTTSRAVGVVLAQFPLALETYFDHYPRHSAVVQSSQELSSRLLVAYTSIACLRRPVSEQTRLLCASEISALDMMVSSRLQQPLMKHATGTSSEVVSLALQEVRAFRRLVFDNAVGVAPSGHTCASDKQAHSKLLGDTGTQLVPAPAMTLLALPYVRLLRPSSLLGYLMCCGPTQLSSPADGFSVGSRQGQADYVQLVTTPPENHCVDSIFSRPLALSEQQSVETARHSLDVFVQRIAVLDDKEAKVFHKAWYNSLVDICSEIL